jgi:pyridoxamine 5'-phosphate oxidase
MSRSDLIPPTPTQADYVAAANDPDIGLDYERPFELFSAWLKAATKAEINDPNAMALATVDDSGLPDVRMVLLKDFDASGFVFYTNTESAKGQQILAHPKAALVFHWKSLRRQVRIRGSVTNVSDAEADAYFQSRARHSQIGAWASDQSRPLEDRFVLQKKVAELALSFGLDKIERPPHWTGFRLVAQSIEFWRDGAFRLHDRLQFTLTSKGTSDGASGGAWTRTKLYP